MDEIFHKTTNPFNVVKIAKEMPNRYGKRGELLINYADTEAHGRVERRRSSVVREEEEKAAEEERGYNRSHSATSEER